MVTSFYELALAKFREQKEAYASHVASGNSPDYGDYRYICGRIYGIEEAEALLKELFEVMVNQKIIN